MKEDSEAWNKRWDSRLRYYECKDPFTSWICRIGAVVINDETTLEAGRKMGSEGRKRLGVRCSGCYTGILATNQSEFMCGT
jgi:hypothetical protein